jgi:hypothetical protein
VDAAGRIAWRGSLAPLTAVGSHQLDVPQDLRSGFYALRISEPGAVHSLKLIVR